MATLSEDDIEKLFSGAPQYFARSEGHFTGAPHPSVAFPWDEELAIRDLTDHAQIEHEAWRCVTAWPHLTRSAGRRLSLGQTAAHVRRAHFYPRCRERPSMLSMQGLEKGTIGYQAALEIAVGDALQEEQWGFDNTGSHKAKAVMEARQKMLTSKEGVRHLEESSILDQLIKNGERYKESNLRKRLSNTLYNELFLGILHPPSRVTDHKDPYSLSVQIQALLKVLGASNVWIDFSHVEWRIRLGQILWGAYRRDGVEDGADIEDADSPEERKEERYWLLLQILLACELLIRLDAITEGEEQGLESIRPSEIHRFEKDATPSVRWAMLLARAWLENIEVTETEVSAETHEASSRPGWLASWTGMMSLHSRENSQEKLPHSQHHHHHHHAKDHKVPVYTIHGRHGLTQVDGLTHFARKLRWPDIELYADRITETSGKVAEATPIHTPMETPASINTRRSSYFGGGRIEAEVARDPARRRKINAALHPAGWLSKSYVSGLMLPGEGLHHFIMSTLLESDQEALDKLGPMANLCGGFVYSGKSFWSTACIVGRVLAAGRGAAECMGWISSDVLPEDLGDGWVNIEVNEVLADVQQTGKKARLWGKTHIERDSAVLGNADNSSVLPADFIIPYENNYVEAPASLEIRLQSLSLLAPLDSVKSTPTEEKLLDPTPLTSSTKISDIRTYPASVIFSVKSGKTGQIQDYTLALSNDVYFVTAHPCVPSSRVKVMRSPSSPTIQQIDVEGEGGLGGGKPSSPTTVTGHPLHKFYTYTVIHLSELLAKSDSSLDDLLLNTASIRKPSLTPSNDKKPRVLVIDCITGISLPPATQDIPASPVLARASLGRSDSGMAAAAKTEAHMHLESRRRQFGSDMEILVRAVCAEKGWNALISRRRRGCLACAIREAGALGWKVIIRVD